MWRHVPEERERIIERETGGELPARDARTRVHGPEKLERAHEVWGQAQQSTPLTARFEHEVEVPVLEIPQATVDEPRRAAGGAAREVILLHQGHAKSPQRGVARDATPSDASAYHEQVKR